MIDAVACCLDSHGLRAGPCSSAALTTPVALSRALLLHRNPWPTTRPSHSTRWCVPPHHRRLARSPPNKQAQCWGEFSLATIPRTSATPSPNPSRRWLPQRARPSTGSTWTSRCYVRHNPGAAPRATPTARGTATFAVAATSRALTNFSRAYIRRPAAHRHVQPRAGHGHARRGVLHERPRSLLG